MSSQQKSPVELEQERDEKEQEKLANFLQHDYDQKVKYLTDHFMRMWARFNYFVAIETALLGGKFFFQGTTPQRQLVVAGIILSAVWYIMRAEDRYLVRLYRNQVKRVSGEFTRTSWPNKKPGSPYRHVGQVDEHARDELHADEDIDLGKKPHWQRWPMKVWRVLTGWRWDPISTTQLTSLFPLIVCLLWVALLLLGL